MGQSSPRAVWTGLLFAGALCFASGVSAVEPATPAASGVYDLVEQGRLALVADQYADASKLFEQAMHRPEFANADPKLQYFAFLLAAYAAEGTKDNLTAHEFLVIATSHPAADGDVWIRRARAALVLEKWSDAGLALTMVATKWPKVLTGGEFHSWLVNRTASELGKEPSLREQRGELLESLYEAGYKMEYGTEPSHLWLTLATDALERKDLKRAREIARRITNSSVLISMRIDKRFDALVADQPRLFDVRAAAHREAKHLKNIVQKNPKSLGAIVQYGYALHTLGRFEEMLSLADGVIAKVEKSRPGESPYEDLDDKLNWIHNHRATALRALGRWEEAASALAAWERSDRNKEDKVSQAINLGFFYNELGRPEDALKAVEGLDWANGMSEYGRTQCQFVRFQAFEQLGRKSDVREVVEWMREHQDDSLVTAQATLLEAGDMDGAAALLVSRLRDTDRRTDALAEIQAYAPTPRTERQKQIDALNETLLARADVAAAITEFGRREKFPTYSLEF
jgi:tetratricopeptide (TPR) repeat protein